ncbi:hypothetical protein LOTGIDRAFT_165873 [Lottia gigantea]|uniref:Corticotropin-releasing factor domain-containing protein n=1 Tax=Lottia gigantea TaxID=225164 RepID=V4BHI0_LOTGI|nr:hypothetical protein LOTGIDRAFT_165873 [Lottia gigantea]ESO88134.1 hypothetical protein LOTGIDRAFT_165873 [Lottia gigantea]
MGPVQCCVGMLLVVGICQGRYLSGYDDGDVDSTDINQPELVLPNLFYPEYYVPSSNSLYKKRNSNSNLGNSKRGTFHDLIERLLALRGDMRSSARKSQMRFGGGRR